MQEDTAIDAEALKLTEGIRVLAMGYLDGAPGSHDWHHVERVRNLCRHIGEIEGGDQRVLEIAAFLHDIGRSYEDASKGTVCHAEKGAEIAASILEGCPLTPARKANIIHCIRTHRFRGNREPRTLEARILFDADKLDAIGAVGIGRAFLFAGEVGATLHDPRAVPEETEPYSAGDTGYREYRVKLSGIKDRMLTPEGKRMALERHAFMERFFARFLKECDGGL